MSGYSKNQIQVQLIPDSWMNLNNKKIVFYDYMESLIFFCISSPFIGLLFAITGDKRALIMSVIAAATITLSMTIIRNIFKKNWLYAFMHIMILALAIIIYEPLLRRIAICLYTFIYMIYSMKKGRSKIVKFYNLNILYFGETALLVVYGVSHHFQCRLLNYYTICCSIVLAIVSLIYLHISRTKNLMEWENHLSKDALSHIRTASRKVVEVIAVLGIALSTVLYATGFFNAGVLPVSIHMSWLFKGTSLKEVVKTQIDNAQGTQNIDLSKLGGKASNSKIIGYIMNFIEISILILGGCFVIMMLIIAVRSICRSIIAYIKGKARDNSDEVESIFDINDMILSAGDKLSQLAKKINFNLSNREKIRRIYYKTVNKNKNKNSVIENYYSPKNIKNVVYNDTKKDIGTATEIYEKARYGKEECTKEDVENMKL